MDNIGLMSETINFIQGSKRNYDSSTMQGGVYFSKDSKEIFLNGESYGNAVPADDEDLTSVNGALQLKDREVNSDNFQSKGYVILRKNLVQQKDGSYKNILTSDMINQPNTIYEIRYDFDLNGVTINVPENCTLKFEGGSLSNGKLLFQDTFITSAPDYIFKNMQIDDKSRCLNTEVYAEWFGAHGDGSTDDTISIQTALDFAYFSQIYKLKLLGRTYLVTDTIWVKDHLCIEGSSYSNYYSSGVDNNWSEFNGY